MWTVQRGKSRDSKTGGRLPRAGAGVTEWGVTAHGCGVRFRKLSKADVVVDAQLRKCNKVTEVHIFNGQIVWTTFQ